MSQRLKQHNEGARLPLTADDFLIARETPQGGASLRHVRRRIAGDGYAEQSVHEHGRAASSFWYYSTTIVPEQMTELGAALMAVRKAIVGVPVAEDPNGVYRVVEFGMPDSPPWSRWKTWAEWPGLTYRPLRRHGN